MVEAFGIFLNSLLFSQEGFENIYLFLMNRIGGGSQINE